MKQIILGITMAGFGLATTFTMGLAAETKSLTAAQSKYATQLQSRQSSTPSGTAAKPAKDPWGCTTADLNTPGASACVDLEENDIMKNTGYFHVVVCSADGSKQCCSGSERTGKIDYCRPVSLTSNPTKGLGNLPSGQMQNAPTDNPPTKTPPTGAVPQTGSTLQKK